MAGTDPKITRRETLTAVLGGALVGAGCREKPAPHPQERSMTTPRMPAVYLPHGGGPWPFMKESLGDPAELEALAAYLRAVRDVPPKRPAALLVISAHWEEDRPTVMSGERPPLLFDYQGFPPETYRLTWPAPGSPSLAARVRELLGAAGFPTGEDARRGFDHGTFVPLKLTYPEAEIPTLQLSLRRGLDPAEHLAMGRALAPLRDEGVFLIGSGMSYHNMRGFFRPSAQVRGESERFDRWLNETIALPPEQRDARLSRWIEAPAARQSHPREEHLLPLMVIAGAAGMDRGQTAYQGPLMGVLISGHRFG
jgi:aromatic ring-opening dioxygenase catalytic subunit (LigB family)